MTAAIVIELAPVDASSPYVAAMLESCNVGAKGNARCMRAPGESGTGRPLVGIVTWEDARHIVAQVEVGVRDRGVAIWRNRTLTFATIDAEVERWRAVGFAIATVAAAAMPNEPSAASPPAPVSAAVVGGGRDAPGGFGKAAASGETAGLPPESSRPINGREESRTWIDAEFLVGTRASGSSPALGGELRVSRNVGTVWFVDGALAYAGSGLAAYRVTIARPTAALGGGAAWRVAPGFWLAVRVDAAMQVVVVSGTDPSTGASGHGARAVPGARESLDAAWAPWRPAALVVGGCLEEWAGATDLRARGQLVGHVPTVDAMVTGGWRWFLP